MRFHIPLELFPIIPTPHSNCFMFFFSEKKSATSPQRQPQRYSIVTYIPPNKDIYSTHTHIAYIVYTINSIVTYTHALTHSRTYRQHISNRIQKDTCHRRANSRSAPGFCIDQVFSFFLCGLNSVPMQYHFPQPITHCTYLEHIQEHAFSTNCPQLTHASKYTPMHTCLHTRTYVRNTHSHTGSVLLCQYTPTYTQSRCLPTHLCTAEQPYSLTLCVIHSHTHIERYIIIHKD